MIFFADKFRFYLLQNRWKKDNADFKKKHPDFPFPPDYLMYESFQMSYKKYHDVGKLAAERLFNTFKTYKTPENLKILDWGCGPARVVRHIPEIFGNSCEVFGTDYNENSINWNRKNIKNVKFNLNYLKAELPYTNDFFDFIYGISIFTHLSEKMHEDWALELKRILKPGGILLLTLQGDEFRKILNPQEKEIYDQGLIVVRGKVKEGHRTYSAFHPASFVKKLFDGFSILNHEKSFNNRGNPEQDVWVLQKR